MQHEKVFVDSNVLLSPNFDFSKYKKVYTAITCIEELDGLKHDEKVGYQARQAIKNIINADNVEVKINYSYSGANKFLEHKNDNIILAFAYETYASDNDCVFLTDDYNLFLKAKALNLPCSLFENRDIKDNYTGWKIIEMDEIELANFYEDEVKANKWDLYINEYLLIKSKEEDKIVDSWIWTDKGFRHIATKRVNSNLLGKLSLKDEYQVCAIDSMFHNKMTMIKGKAGSGKSLLSLSYAMSMIEKGTYDKLIIFTNPTPARNSSKLGFYPGTRLEKILETSTGNMLISKIGDRIQLEQLINQNKINILPFCDIRGYDTTNMKAIVYIPEAQNLDIELMKIAIQRIGDDCQLIIDGDYNAQVDLQAFEGNNNGMKRVSEVFRGQSFYGEVELPIIYRSKMAEWAEKL